MKTRTQYFIDVDNWEDVEIPFPVEENSIISKTVGNKFYIGALRHDEQASNPIKEFDQGKLVQFNSYYGRFHGDMDRPDSEDFKRLIRQNPGRIVLIYANRHNGDYHADERALTVKETKGKYARCYEVEDAQGYYIAPEDVDDAAKYAKGVMAEYSAWCQGQCYGVCIFEYAIIETDNGQDLEYINDDCVWGFYGSEYAEEELKRMIDDK